MPLKVWIGENIEHPQELRAASVLLEKLSAIYKNSEETCHVLFNFLIDSNPLDAAVIKSNSIIILEFKDVSCPVTGGENGTWFLNDNGKKVNIKGGIHGNPYKQVRAYRFAFRDLLIRRANDFLTSHPEPVPFNVALFGIVAFSPLLHHGSVIKVSDKEKWFRVSGVDRLHETVVQCTSPRLQLSNKEMERLIIKVLQLEEAQMVEWTPIKPNPITAQEDVVIISSEPVTKAIKTVKAPIPQKTTLKPPEEILEEIVFSPVASKKVTEPDCIVCMFGGESCDKKHLSGSLKEIASDDSSIQIEVKEHGISSIEINLYKIEFNPKTNKAMADSLLFLKLRLQNKKKTNISFWHLSKDSENALVFKMNTDSIFLFEPDWLINVNNLRDVDYCHRQLLVKKYVQDAPGAPVILGSVVHQAFSDIWNGDRDLIDRTVQSAVNAQALSLLTSSTVPEDVVDIAQAHIEHLLAFANNQGRKSILRSETFVLSPILGLKGKIDAVWEQDGKPVIVGELKTGKTKGADPKPEDVHQVAAYSFMLMVRGSADPKTLLALLLYSGNDTLNVLDGRNVKRNVPLNLEQMKKVLMVRNQLVAIELSGDATYTTNLNKCRPCKIATDCYRIGKLSKHNDPRPEGNVREILGEIPVISENDITFFSHFSSLLIDEFVAAKSHHSDLWSPDNKQFQESGKYLEISKESPPVGHKYPGDGFFYYILTTNGVNNSELRSNDYVILSAEYGPVRDRAAIATIFETSESSIVVRMSEELIFQPTAVYSYVDESLIARTFRGLYRFLIARPELMQILFTEGEKPTYNTEYEASEFPEFFLNELNTHQNEAVLKSLQSDHFLLVNGPPGAGKTTLITRMVLAHLHKGERVLIATSTNRALDQVLTKIVRYEGYSDELLRLGSSLSASDELKTNTISDLVSSSGLSQTQAALMSRKIVGATISTLLSGSYSIGLDDFDLVIVDEATQSTMPATLGAISFGKRFVLIGDPKQLPPIVQNSTRIDKTGLPNLDISLFVYLYEKFGSNVCVPLEEQYRMNDVICNIPSVLWYEPELKLRPATKEIASKRIVYKNIPQDKLCEILVPEKPFVFVDVDMNPSDGQRTNLSEAVLVADILTELLKITDTVLSPFDNVSKSAEKNSISVAVISPYRSQVALIRRQLLERDPSNRALWTKIVDSVDRFQGSEADLVIISLSPWTEKVSDHIANPQRLNVAMTRARKKLIMLGCRSHLEQHELFQSLFKNCDDVIGKSSWYYSKYHGETI